ncbi:MAG: ABC transporter permease subunit [Planctomycetes bacterium]|nr:ABC transporter permease subunit [Planctomycetota bacterium]
MLAYLVRRALYAVPIILGVVLITFVLFFVVNKPEDMARRTLGPKATPEAVAAWVRAHGYDLPLFYNARETGLDRLTSTLLFQKCGRLVVFDLGRSDASDRDVGEEIVRRMGPSLAIAVPSFLLGMAVNITIALIIAVCRGTYLDRWGTVGCVLLMSVSALFYIIGGQFIFALWLRLFPISGFDWSAVSAKFVFLPVVIGVVAGIGGAVRYYRTIFLEEIGKDYVRTARAKGLSESVVLFRHVLKNAMIPILTNAVMVIPFLFMGSLLMESFFSIPGLGSMTITAIHAQDFAVIRSMTYIGAILYIMGLLMTDISYTLVDPRITLGASDTRSLYGRTSWRDVAKVAVGFVLLAALAVGVWRAAVYVATLRVRVPVFETSVLAATLLGLAAFLLYARRSVLWRAAWRQVRQSRLARASLGVLSIYILIAVLDSVAWRDVDRSAADAAGGAPATAAAFSAPRSVLDRLCAPLASRTEKTYSAPLADHLLAKETVEVEVGGQIERRRDYPPLAHPGWHLLGTDKTGQDVFFMTLKSVRTGLIVGGLTTLIAVPFAIFFGVVAGFFGGWVDDVIQYLYSTLASIPWILLVVCFMIVFGQGLPQLCVVMGLTSWVGLCRVLRGETLKLREREYVQAALALGVSRARVLARHIVPNVMHLVLINVVLGFSGLVLAEAVLSYVGVGVGPGTYSWGTMINLARGELGREPLVWWNLAAAFVAMFGLVLPANLFGDALRDALDPSLRVRGIGE